MAFGIRRLGLGFEGVAMGGGTLGLACLCWAFAPAAASAQSDPAKTWDITLGGGAILHPTYEGADSYHIDPWPVFDLTWNDRVSISTIDGIHVTALKWDDFRFGAAGNLRFGRQPHDDKALNNLPRVKDSLELGGFLEYNPKGVDVLFEVRHDVLGGHNGTIAELEAHLQLQPTRRLGIEFGPNLSWADANFMRRYFGVDRAHAPLAGLPAYHPGGGFKSVGLFLGTEFKLTEHWEILSNATYSHLLGPALHSPLIKNDGSPNQFEFGLFLAYHF